MTTTKSYTFKLGDTARGIYWLTVKKDGSFKLRSAANIALRDDWLLGNETAEFALLLATAAILTDNAEAAITKVVNHYHKPLQIPISLWSAQLP